MFLFKQKNITECRNPQVLAKNIINRSHHQYLKFQTPIWFILDTIIKISKCFQNTNFLMVYLASFCKIWCNFTSFFLLKLLQSDLGKRQLEVFITLFKLSNPPTHRSMRHQNIPIDIITVYRVTCQIKFENDHLNTLFNRYESNKSIFYSYILEKKKVD